MLPFYTRLTNIASCYVHAYPNAGLPNEMGGYDETKEEFSNNLAEFAAVGANMLGGCCGTDRTFIKALADRVQGLAPRVTPEAIKSTMLSGMQDFVFYPEMNFVNIGE